jgi:hypothetical protein
MKELFFLSNDSCFYETSRVANKYKDNVSAFAEIICGKEMYYKRRY